MANLHQNMTDSSTFRRPSEAPVQNEKISIETAELFPFQIVDRTNVLLLRLTELDFRRTSFIHQIAHSVDGKKYILPLNEFAGLAKNLAVSPCNRYIFHISHVGSTLLSKILGQQQQVLSLREPLLLRWLAELLNNLEKPESVVSPNQFDEYFAACLVYYSRKFRPDNEVVIKATSYTNVLADRILGQSHLPQAVFVYSSFPAYLATILKTPASVNAIYDLAPSRLARLHRLVNADTWKLYELGVGEVLAMSWACEMLTLELAAKGRASQVSWLDFDEYLKSDIQTQVQLFDHMKIRYSTDDVARLRSGETMQTYSKDPARQYDKLARAKDIAFILKREAIAAEQGKAWLEKGAAMHPAIAGLAVRAKL
jgi:hypothetical protein